MPRQCRLRGVRVRGECGGDAREDPLGERPREDRREDGRTDLTSWT